jgi:hypothetical protein
MTKKRKEKKERFSTLVDLLLMKQKKISVFYNPKNKKK